MPVSMLGASLLTRRREWALPQTGGQRRCVADLLFVAALLRLPAQSPPPPRPCLSAGPVARLLSAQSGPSHALCSHPAADLGPRPAAVHLPCASCCCWSQAGRATPEAEQAGGALAGGTGPGGLAPGQGQALGPHAGARQVRLGGCKQLPLAAVCYRHRTCPACIPGPDLPPLLAHSWCLNVCTHTATCRPTDLEFYEDALARMEPFAGPWHVQVS